MSYWQCFLPYIGFQLYEDPFVICWSWSMIYSRNFVLCQWAPAPFHSIRFSVSSFMLRPLLHSDLCVGWYIWIYLYFVCMLISVRPEMFGEDAFPFPNMVFLSSKNYLYVRLFILSVRLDSIDQPNFFYSNSIQFLLLLLCTSAWF